MNAGSQPWTLGSPEAVVDAPEALLADLGWASPSGAASRRANSAQRAGRPSTPCGFCWSPLVPGDAHCPDCGQSVAEMERQAAQQAAADRSWRPGRLQGDGRQAASYSKRAPLQTVTNTVSVGTAPMPGVRRRRQATSSLQTVAWIGGGVVFFAGAAGLGFWLALNTFPEGAKPQSSGAPPLPVAAVSAHSGNGDGGGVARVRWSSPSPELVYELQTLDGKPVASSRAADPTGIGIQPGDYVLYAASKDGAWRQRWQDLKLKEAQEVNLSPPSGIRAGYLAWRGARLHEGGDDRGAESSWREAIRLDPKAVDARLELAALLAVGFRYREAQTEVAEVLRNKPGNATARRLSETLKRLEKTR